MLLAAAGWASGTCRCHQDGSVALTGTGVTRPLLWILSSHRAALTSCGDAIVAYATMLGIISATFTIFQTLSASSREEHGIPVPALNKGTVDTTKLTFSPLATFY